ncbi:Rof/RNase P-like protein [Thamnocephalis sphaerospora]|uniref:Ribonuclease P protein subunit n=1 Tax=Thamnocephalis sphaerospora TaxID=78915 RepID=A0A4P9XVE3_9FUNG|nr:Rof/RNase P-like protein [Thamnocephalis sphaerospora]|eukprot:RKP10228.1 Rof/RNase P-like protein [Thamnocephalis sphaerospora]
MQVLAGRVQTTPSDGSTGHFAAEYVQSAIEAPQQSQQAYRDKVKGKVLSLENPVKESAEKRRRRQRQGNAKPQALTAREKRSLGVHQLSHANRSYATFEPLHALWCQYIAEVRGSGGGAKALLPKLLKADLHGSMLTVTRSRCPNYVGVTGIMVMETKNIFHIIDRRNKLRAIPKAHSVFSLCIQGHEYLVYGDQFCHRSGDRAAKKFKGRPTVDL